ncbi:MULTISPECIES: DUF932 domain-containing protein [Legionella]|uniref:DUF932 domain-containing protein n=1 Tax=Legionella TaxID=445 RepID=UPI00095CBA73|nr:DUF932 domain-containing protein [Legionella sp. 39-23]OJW06843.1 MAG: hypothetical protein BGO44_13920 [Legionella sp. 39-23]HAU0661270.1 DUF945 domain-containing protein [Legionella pneumophila]
MLPVLSKEKLFKLAPSIFTQASSHKTSNKYAPISTEQIIDKLMSEGFFPTWATQTMSQRQESKAFAKHMLRFQRHDALQNNQGLYPELVLINSHDGLSSYRLMAGLFRLVCGNGMIAGQAYNEIRIKHQGDVIGNVIEGTYKVIETANQMLDVSDDMASIHLNADEKGIFAEAAHALKFSDEEGAMMVKPQSLLQPRRYVDQKDSDLFTVFNVIQENLIKGGIRGYRLNKYGYTTRTKTREVKAIDQNVKLNRALWTLTEKMMEMKR